MKNQRVFLAAIISLFALSSCSLLDPFLSITESLQDQESQKIRDVTVVEFSKTGLKSLFAPTIANQSNFDQQIDALASFLESYAKASGDGKEVKDIGKGDKEVSAGKDHYFIQTAVTYDAHYDSSGEMDGEAHYLFTYYCQVASPEQDLIGLHYLTFYLLNTRESLTLGNSDHTSLALEK